MLSNYMRPFLIKLVSILLILISLDVTFFAKNLLQESRMIRRLFLDTKQIPPTPDELNWYLCFNPKPYQAAVNWIVDQTGASKEYLLSEEYTQSFPSKIDQSLLDFIIKYQCGNTKLTVEEADKLLIKVAIAGGEDNTTDVIDYMSFCLMARSTNIRETNELLKIYKQYPKEEDGYYAVLQQMKTYSDYRFK